MHADDDPETPRRRERDGRAARTEREFTAIVAALRRTDPCFVRRFSPPPAKAWIGAGAVMTLAGLVTTVLLGIVPLTVGLNLRATAPLAIGAVCCMVLPIAMPLATGRFLAHVRPLWL